jgi:putative two-component system response regulator
MKQHSLWGADVAEKARLSTVTRNIIAYHHERYDGTGYPDRLAGVRIPLLARVLAVADVYDALVSDRPYRAGWAPELAVSHIVGHSGSHFDPAVVKAFLELVEGPRSAEATGGHLVEPDFRLAGLGA